MLPVACRILLLAIVAVSASPTQACRVFLPPTERIAFGYERGAISAVALVRISKATYISPPRGDAHPWRAEAAVERALSGSFNGKRVIFHRGHGSAACDDGHPAPRAGNRWIIYFWKSIRGDHEVWQSYPAAEALRADPRLKGILAPQE
jgi:hypothetical protein